MSRSRSSWRHESDAVRLDAALAARLAPLSRGAAQRAIADGRVRLDGVVAAKPSASLSPGVLVEVDLEERGAEGVAELPPVVHRDEHLLVLDKPAGLVVHAGAGTPHRDTLAAALSAAVPEVRGVGDPRRPGIVHRIDKNTSGLLLAALSPAAHERLTLDLRKHAVKRGYTALAAGRGLPPRATIDAPLARSPAARMRRAVVAGGKPARTRYEVIAELDRYTLLRIELETGRTHQIRAHLAAVGAPLVGDRLYGGGDPFGLGGRQFLHAHRLRLSHPVTRAPLEFSTPLPRDLAGVLAKLNYDMADG